MKLESDVKTKWLEAILLRKAGIMLSLAKAKQKALQVKYLRNKARAEEDLSELTRVQKNTFYEVRHDH
jgi:hypothetical protein